MKTDNELLLTGLKLELAEIVDRADKFVKSYTEGLSLNNPKDIDYMIRQLEYSKNEMIRIKTRIEQLEKKVS